MARSESIRGEMKPMRELPDFKVESGDPDPRGWTVVDSAGRKLGAVTDLMVDTAAMKVRQLIVDLDRSATGFRSDTGTVLIDVNDVDVRRDDHKVVAGDISGMPAYDTARLGTQASSGDRRTMTRAEEELKIGKREVSGGEARVSKHVETEHVSQPVTRRHEEVVVERRPVSGEVRADASIKDDEIRIPLKDEEVVVEKRPVVKEELVVGKRVVEEHETVETDVKRERFDVESTDQPKSGRPRGDRNP